MSVIYSSIAASKSCFENLPLETIYCLGVFAAQQRLQDQKGSHADNCALITIMNADGIYLATYAALLLNLKLIRMNYYEDESRQVPMNEVSLYYTRVICENCTVQNNDC